MQFTLQPLDEEDARIICAWHYEDPYSAYNVAIGDTATLSQMLDRRSPYYAVRDEHDELVGFYAFGSSAEVSECAEPGLYTEDQTITIGLGMRPDLTSKGMGLAFVNAGLDYARQQFAPQRFRLFVLTFNQRAIRVYEKAGFQRVRVFMQRNIHGELEFLEMSRQACM